MQAIVTKYLGPTNVRGSRVKASCDRGSITISYPHELSGDRVHVAAADALVAKFAAEDRERYGGDLGPWSTPRVCGQLPDGTYAHVFLPNVDGRAYSVEAGRGIVRDGVRIATLRRVEFEDGTATTTPTESDDLVKRIVDLLNGASS